MKLRITALATMLCAGIVCADDASDRGKLAGEWQAQAAEDQNSAGVWILENTGDAIHITHLHNNQKVADYSCNTMGKECTIKDTGHPAKVSLWFSGPKLVELETRGNEVLKRRFCTTGQGDGMDLEVIPIAPGGKTEVLHFHRAPVAAARQ